VSGTTAIRAALAGLDRAGIGWVLLRESLEPPLAGDIDLLVSPGDAGRLGAALGAAGFLQLRAAHHWPHRFFYAYSDEADAWVKLDVVDHLVFGGTALSRKLVKATLDRRRRVDDVWRLSAADEFWALLLHSLIDTPSVAERHARRLAALLDEGVEEGPIFQVLRDCQEASSTAIRLAKNRSWQQASPLRDELRRCVRGSGRGCGQRLTAWLRSRFGLVLNAGGRPGMRVALLGPDGAGKSTLIADLAERLPLPTRTFYLGLYGVQAERRSAAKLSRVVLLRRIVRLWRAYVAGWYHRYGGRLVLYDRHGYEALMPARSGHTSSRRRILRLLVGRLAPRPELVVLLDAPSEVLRARKPEHTIRELDGQRRRYRYLAQRVPATLVVDTAAGTESVRRQLAKAIWRRLAGDIADPTDVRG
jgi:thymidylate kinase